MCYADSLSRLSAFFILQTCYHEEIFTSIINRIRGLGMYQ
ncbi:hypothetical protein SAMN06265219_1156 [Gracilimonas mengyeensis]|uniref:Uncharacterized protein n=1 Tax=Gracilimonas mengyeensis TaxID=1302730 RepID=A0A521F3L7_9BACT|nr:hypothetical protein SAMN06265219_1156 [Gracilimonas mengyeensis]